MGKIILAVMVLMEFIFISIMIADGIGSHHGMFMASTLMAGPILALCISLIAGISHPGSFDTTVMETVNYNNLQRVRQHMDINANKHN
jgi:hypothetical protein